MVVRASDDWSSGRIDLLATLLLVMASAILMNLPERAQHAVGQSVRSSVLQPFLAVNGAVTRYKARAIDYDRLRAQYDSLLTLVAARGTLAEENRQLRGLLSLPQRSPAQFVPVTVVRPGTTAGGSVFFVDAGAEQGVEQFDAVVTEAGLLGQVQDVRARSATAFDWSHPDFRASAMSADGTAHGLVEPFRGAYREQDRLLLRGTAYLSGLEPGDEILTSGRGGTLPRGVLIGWVQEVADTSAGWSASYWVQPAVQPGAVTHASVETGLLPEPEPELEGAADSLEAGSDSLEFGSDSVASVSDSLAPTADLEGASRTPDSTAVAPSTAMDDSAPPPPPISRPGQPIHRSPRPTRRLGRPTPLGARSASPPRAVPDEPPIPMTALLLTLFALHMLLRAGFGFGAGSPDLAMVAVLVGSRVMSTRWAAATGFAVGLAEDALAMTAFGAFALATTVVGAGAARLRASFVGESTSFLAAYFFLGKWGRDLLAWSVSGPVRPDFVRHFLLDSLVATLYVTVVGVALLLFFPALSRNEK